jgi:cell division protein FtsL
MSQTTQTTPVTKEAASQPLPKAVADKQPLKAKTALRKIFGYEWVLHNINFILFLALLAVVYIYNGHQSDRTIRQINRTAKEIKQLQYEYKTLKSELMYKSREAELLKATEPLGLTLTRTPHQRIPATNTAHAQQRKANE